MNMYADIFPTFVSVEVRNELFETTLIINIDTGIINIGDNIHKMKKKFETYMRIVIKIANAIVIFIFGRRE